MALRGKTNMIFMIFAKKVNREGVVCPEYHVADTDLENMQNM